MKIFNTRLFRDIKHYKNYIHFSAWSKLNAELADFKLGWLWWILEPTVDMLIYYFVYTVVFQRTAQYLVASIFIGLIIWRFFQKSVQSSASLLKQYRSILTRSYLPKTILLTSLLLINFIKLLFSLVPLILLFLISGITIGLNALSVIPLFVSLIIWTFVICAFSMHIGVYVADLTKVITILLRIMFYASGVFYSATDLNNKVISAAILKLNPIARIIDQARNCLLFNKPCNWSILIVHSIISILLLFISCSIIYKKEGKYLKVM